jgi:flagellar basal body-associated protein FliL
LPSLHGTNAFSGFRSVVVVIVIIIIIIIASAAAAAVIVVIIFCSVSDEILQEEVGQKELVNVEGVICDRLHTDVKYDSEKVPHVSGYGIPGKFCKGEVHEISTST